jgi:bifunctional ADP-heptose synthase (sugar kinase/adenylyltransferase)
MFNIQKMKVTLIGPITKDTIFMGNLKKRTRIGGSIYYAAETFKKMGWNVEIIPILAKKDSSLFYQISQGIKILPIYKSKTIEFKNIYSKKNYFERIQKTEEYSQKLKKEDIKNKLSENIDLIFLGPQSASDLTKDTIDYIYEKNKNICLYSQGLLRKIEGNLVVFDKWKNMKEYLNKTKYLIINSNELKFLLKNKSEKELWTELRGYGIHELILSKGEKGFTIYNKKERIEMNYPSKEDIINPNGATSTFSAAYLSQRLKNNSIIDSAEIAITATFLKLKKWGGSKKNISELQKIINLKNKIIPELKIFKL